MANPVALHIPLLAAHERIWEGQYRARSWRLVPREHALRRTTLMREHRSSHDAGRFAELLQTVLRTQGGGPTYGPFEH